MLLHGLDVPEIDGGSLSGKRRFPWYRTTLSQVRGEPPHRTRLWAKPREAGLDVSESLSLRVRPAPGTDGGFEAHVTAPAVVAAEELAHPVASFVAAAVASWTHRSAFHAASVELAGGTWLLIAPPDGGKSTLAVALSMRGHRVLGDDTAVVEKGVVLAGPRISDLRPASAARLGVGTELDPSGTRRGRWRVSLGSAPAESPLAGFVVLRWGGLAVASLGAVERLSVLARARILDVEQERPDVLLDLARLPFFSLSRDRESDDVHDMAELVEREFSS